MGGLAVVEYGVGNLFSLGASLRHIGCAAAVTADARALDAADGIILPGVGAFGDAADRLRAAGLFEPLRALGRAGKPREWDLAAELKLRLPGIDIRTVWAE